MTRRSLAIAIGLLLISSVPGLAADGTAGAPDRDGDGLSDAFEEQWGLTSPDILDSDGDGLSDAAEDSDGDRLGGLGEQRFGTDPGNADSDGDGTLDGDEDSDGDGTPDFRQQDARPVPDPLTPTPDAAWWDRPVSYDEGCHGGILDPELYPCVYGDETADRTVAIFGDSHALQWLPAIIGAGLADGWRVVTLTKSACPAADVVFERGPQYDGADPTCTAWRAAALDWIAQNTPDLVVLSSAGRQYKLLDGSGKRVPDEDRLAHWQQGLASVLGAMPDETTAVVLADTPRLRSNPASCLPEHADDISACVTTRWDALDPTLDSAEAEVAEQNGALFDSLNDQVCPYDPCPVVIGDTMMWRNNAHITATFAEQLAPSMSALLERSYVLHEGRFASTTD